MKYQKAKLPYTQIKRPEQIKLKNVVTANEERHHDDTQRQRERTINLRKNGK